MIPVQSYSARRAHLAEAMGAGVAIIPTSLERVRSRDSHHPYRFDSYFYYLTGFREPEAVLMLVTGDEPRSILFCRDKDPEREIWDGDRCGPQAAREAFGFDEAHPIAALEEMAPKLLAGQPTVFCPVGADAAWDARIVAWINRLRADARSGVAAPSEIHDVRAILDEMRLIKDPEELTLMRRAAEISAAAHRRAMHVTQPGMREYQIEAELMHEFRRQGARAPAYLPVVAGGANACVLHYIDNGAELKAGDLLLIDAACEWEGYASDITRTFPVSGKYSGAQREVYELVLAAQRAAIGEVKPGKTWDAPHEAALKVLVRGMIDFGLCQGTVDGVIDSGDYKRFYMHRTGHWLGLDVHDAGEYQREGKWRPLAPGMTLTVEPGFYVRPAENVPEKFWNIGVRIEDDVVVTESGCEVLTAAAPKTIAEVEALMAEAAQGYKRL